MSNFTIVEVEDVAQTLKLVALKEDVLNNNVNVNNNKGPADLFEEDDLPPGIFHAYPSTSPSLTCTYEDEGTLLGEGGFGVVTSGIRKEDGAPVALKRVEKSSIKNWKVLGNGAKIPLEVYLLSRVSQVEGVIKLLECFEEEAGYIIVTERPSPCQDLFDYITDKGTLDEEEAAEFFRQLVSIVVALHELGVVHRDIKDENVLVDEGSNRLKMVLIDFGAAAVIEDDAQIYKDFDGTRVYAPPEWLSRRQYNGLQATVWSLGILLYAMVAGDIPYQTDKDILSGHLTFPPEARVSGPCQDLIRRCLSMSGRKRPSLSEVMGHEWLKMGNI